MRSFSFAVLLALVAAVPASLAAQQITSPYEYIETTHSVGLFGGYLLTSDGRIDVGPKSAPLFGARYGINLAGPLYGDLSLGVLPSKRDLYMRTANVPNPPLIVVGETDAVLMLAEAGLRFQVTGPRTWHGFAPYVALSAGLINNLTPGDPLEENLTDDQLFRFGPAFAAGASLGTDYFVTERISVRLDLKDHFWRLNYPIGLTGTAEKESQWRHNFGFTLGSAIHF